MSFARIPRAPAPSGSLALALVGSLLLSLAQGCRTAAPTVVPTPPAPRQAMPPMLVPQPTSLRQRDGAGFSIVSTTAIVAPADDESRAIAEQLGRQLRTVTGFALPIAAAGDAGAANIRMTLDPAAPALGDEGYELESDAAGLRIRAFRPAGLFHGVQTLRQLLPFRVESHIPVSREPWLVPAVSIADAPRFAWRGAMLDVARHFFTVKEVEQFIDLLALYKLNVLHLHLSDDQGWRIEIRSRPRLAQMGGATQVGGGPGGFYTQDEYRAIVAYAQARYVTIVPEIDMPGHSNAALVAYPDLSCSRRVPALYTGVDVGWSTFCVENEATYALVDDVVRELAEMTPGPYIHLGGDEVEALTPAQYARFVERVQEIATRHGKRMVGWEEVAHARLVPTTIAQHWRSDSVVKALAYGAKVILSPGRRTYLDMKYTPDTELGLRWAGFIGVRTAYDWDPAVLVPGVAERDIIGIEAPIWSETLRNITAVEYLAVPRLPAIAEVGWTAQSVRDWTSFQGRLAAHAPRWRLLGINYNPTIEIPW